jgi:hypothetical protein
MPEIALTYSRKTLVDARDYDSLIQYIWFAKREQGRWYAARRDYDDNIIYMHNEIAKPEPGWGVRHAEPYQTLNNRRENLVRYRIEMIDATIPRTPKRLYRGVTEIRLVDGTSKYVARIRHDRDRITLGRFTDVIEAAKAYDRANYDLNGEKALAEANFRDDLLEYVRGRRREENDEEYGPIEREQQDGLSRGLLGQ